MVNGHAEEHFLAMLHIKAMDAETITDATTSYMESKNLSYMYRKLIGQGYDGAVLFSGPHSGVQRRIRVHAGHAIYIHCSCHRLQLASIQAAQSVPQIQRMFGMITSLWKLFCYSPGKAEKLKEVQAILNLPEFRIVKPSSTLWLSHECCVKAIRKELPTLILTLQQLYEASCDAEAYGVQLLLTSFSGIASVVLLSEVLNTLAKFNCFMQRKTTDFSRLKMMLDTFVEHLTSLKLGNSERCLTKFPPPP